MLAAAILALSLGAGTAPPLKRAIGAQAAQRTLYLLAATPQGGNASAAYPVNLYTIGRDESLRLARVIVGMPPSRNDFFRRVVAVRGDQRRGLFILWGGDLKEGYQIDVVDQKNPLQVNNFKYAHWSDDELLAVAQGPRQEEWLLLSRLVATGVWEVTRVIANPDAPARAEAGAWSDFSRLRYAGNWTGPFPGPDIDAQVANGGLFVPTTGVRTGPAWIGPIPANLPERDRAMRWFTDSMPSGPVSRGAPVSLTVLFSTDKYFSFLDRPVPNAAPGASPIAFIYNRERRTWSNLALPFAGVSNGAYVRIFGDWLVSPVVQWVHAPDPDGESPLASLGPSSQGERDWNSLWYPNVQDAYVYRFTELCCRMPGQVQLRNLADGRVLTLDTGRQDTEILDIDADGTMLYRVDDKIYSAKILSQGLGPARLIVHGDDVPEVHWAFWSPQPPPDKPVGMENAIAH